MSPKISDITIQENRIMIRSLSRVAACGLLLGFTASSANAHFEEGQIWIVDQLSDRLYFVNPANFNVNVSLDAADGLDGPGALGFSLHGDMILGNYAGNSIFEIESDLSITPVLSSTDGLCGPFGGNAITIGPGEGDVYIANFDCSTIMRFDKEYENGVVFADATDGLVRPGAMAFLANGDMLIADRGAANGSILLADEAGNVSSFFVTPTAEKPISIAVRNNYDVYVLTTFGNIFRFVGGDPNAVQFLGNYGGQSLRGGIILSPDHSEILHVSTADSFLRSIDPDNGASAILATIPGGGGGTAIFTPNAQYAPGTASEFGEPVAGTGGVEPTLEGLGAIRIGQPLSLAAENFLGGAQIVTFIGFDLEESILFGSEFHIDLNEFHYSLVRTTGGTIGAAGEGSFTYNFNINPDPSLVYLHVYAQTLGFDPLGVQGFTFSNCLDIYLGE